MEINPKIINNRRKNMKVLAGIVIAIAVIGGLLSIEADYQDE